MHRVGLACSVVIALSACTALDDAGGGREAARGDFGDIGAESQGDEFGAATLGGGDDLGGDGVGDDGSEPLPSDLPFPSATPGDGDGDGDGVGSGGDDSGIGADDVYDCGAAFERYATRAAFEADYPLHELESFEDSLLITGAAESASPWDASTSDANWAPGGIVPGMALSASTGPLVVVAPNAYGPGLPADTIVGPVLPSASMTIDFDQPVSAVGLSLLNALWGLPVDIEVFDGQGAPLHAEAVDVQLPVAARFVGVCSKQGISRIEVRGQQSGAEMLSWIAFAD